MDVSYQLLAAATPPGSSGDDSTRTPSDRAEQFVAVSGSESEQVNASAMVVAAYALFWLLAVAFIYVTYRNQSRMSARVADLESRLAKHAAVVKDPAP